MDRVNTKISRRPDGNGCDENASVVNRAPVFLSQLHKQTWLEKFKFQQLSNPKFNNPAVQSSLKHPGKSSSNFFGGIFPALPPSIQFSFASKHKKTRQGKSPHLMHSHEVVKDRRRRRCCPRKPAILSNHGKPDPELRSKLGWLTGYRSLFFKPETKKEIDRKISSARSRWL